MPEQVGLGLLGFPAITEMAEAGRAAEDAGFESVWVAETRITRDAVSAMTAILLATERVRVGSAAINVFTRGAGVTAVTWATLAEATPGRVILGVGPGSAVPLRQQGYDFEHPLERLREFVSAVRSAWSGAPSVDFDGKFVRFESLTPEVIPDVAPPVYLCVTGPQALKCAGELSDGVVLNAFMPPSYVERARQRLDEGAGGKFEGEVAGALVTTVGDSIAESAARVRPILATYLVHFPHLAKETDLDPDFLEALRKTAADDGLEATFAHLPDDLVAQHAVCGTPADCLARLDDYRSAGLELPLLFPDPESLRPVIEKLSKA